MTFTTERTASGSIRIERLQACTARIIGLLVFVLSLAVLIGRVLPFHTSKEFIDRRWPMPTSSALAFALLGVLLLRTTGTSEKKNPSLTPHVIAGLVIAISFFALLQYVFGVDFSLDRLVSDDGSIQFSARMSLLTATTFALLGWACLLDNRAEATASHSFALIGLTVGYLEVMAHLYGANSIYQGWMTHMSMPAAVLFLLTSAGLMLARSRSGFMRLVSSSGSGGVLLRRLLPVALLAAPAIDWLQTQMVRQNQTAAAVMLALATVVLLVFLAWWTAYSIALSNKRKRHAEAQVATSEERLRLALQAAGGGGWDWDMQRNTAWWSPELYELWDTSAPMTKRVEQSMDAILPEDRPRIYAEIQRAKKLGTPFECEFRVGSRGTERWMAAKGRVYRDASGEPRRLLGIALDVSAQKRIESDLRRTNEALQRSNAELLRFAHVAAHDLQTPLRSIAGFAELIREHYGEHLDARGKDWTHRIVDAATHLHALVKALLQYAQLDNQAREFEPVPMNQVLQRVTDLLAATIHDSAAVVTASELPVVLGNRALLTRLLLNLLSNAIKYRSAAPPEIHVSARRNGEESVFSVRDNGIGIDARHAERIFEMFERVHASKAPADTGIGLAICRRVVQLHGGRIWVESTPGKGSEFFFTLVLAEHSHERMH